MTIDETLQQIAHAKQDPSLELETICLDLVSKLPAEDSRLLLVYKTLADALTKRGKTQAAKLYWALAELADPIMQAR